MLESNFQHKVIKELETKFPGCTVLKNDPTYIDSIPDLTVLYKSHYALLEVKRSEKAMIEARDKKQKNQNYYIQHFNEDSFASYIYPENKEEVFHQLETFFNGGQKDGISMDRRLETEQTR